MKKTRILHLVLMLHAVPLCLLNGEAADVHVHILQKNETLYSISRRYDVSVDSIISQNDIHDPENLPVGKKLKIPGTDSPYTVTKGETLYGIAGKHGLTVNELKDHNGLSDSYVLKAGDVLSIPAGESRYSVVHAPAEEDGLGNITAGTTPGSAEKEPSEVVSIVPDGPEGFWPLEGERRYLEGKLQGIQIHGAKGDPVRSISSGKVIWVGPYRGFGRVVLVQASDNYIYVYGGNETTNVEVGDTVDPGTVISSLGKNPHLQEPVLFFTVFRNGKPVSPENAPRL